jgi:1,4-alpha-glucan branching enzyme
MWATPGKKLLFMGGEFGQWREWNHEAALDWDLLSSPVHRQISDWVDTLNRLLKSEPALHRADHDAGGFRWVEADDHQRAALAFLRLAPGCRPVLVLLNFTPVPWDRYRVGVPEAGAWKVVASSDHPRYGGTGQGPIGTLFTEAGVHQGHDQSLVLTLPPLSALFMVPSTDEKV